MTGFGLALLSAALTILLYPGFDLTLLAPLCLAPLLVAAARESSPRRRFLIGWAAGVLYWGSVCYWISFVLENHAGMNAGLAWLAFALFSLAKGLHWAVFSTLSGYLMPLRAAILLVPALWVGIERTNGPFGFAWLTLGNAGIDMALPMRTAPFAGVYGLSFLFGMMNVALALLVLRRPRRDLLPLVLLPLLFLLPRLPDTPAATESAVVVQANIEERSDWSQDLLDETLRSLSLASLEEGLKSKPPLVIWPEAPAPFYYDSDAAFRAEVTQLARTMQASLIFAGVAHTPAGEPLNSAYLLASDGSFTARYDKMFLVPFGEFVPSPFRWVNKVSDEAGDFAPGNEVKLFPFRESRAGVFICYESAFPHLVRQFADAGADSFINLSNDGYFGHSSAREQHLSLARMRAAENRRWLVRATNNGITAVIDPAGTNYGAFEALRTAGGNNTLWTDFGEDSVHAHGRLVCVGMPSHCARMQRKRGLPQAY